MSGCSYYTRSLLTLRVGVGASVVPWEKLLKRLKEVIESSSAEGLATSWDPRLPFRKQKVNGEI